MNPRRLAGSRRNKHLPIAREPRFSDRLVELDENRAEHYEWWAVNAEKSGLDPVSAGIWRRNAAALHDPAQGSKPDHAARAVDIRTIWPPLTLDDSTAKQRKAAEAGARGKSAAPMSRGQRAAAYQKQTGRRGPTARQARQLDRMDLLRAS